MKKINKKDVYTGIIIGIISLFVMIFIGLSRVEGGLSALFEEKSEMLILFPFWAICFGYAGYGFSKVYKEQKVLFLSNYQAKTVEEKDFLVKIFKLKTTRNFANYGSRLSAVLIPLFGLAYLDNSEWIHSSLALLIVLAVVAIVCFILTIYLNKKYLKQKSQIEDNSVLSDL